MIAWFVFNISTDSIHAQDTIFIENDTALISSGPKINLQGDTTVILNLKGEVVEGTLKANTYLWTGRRLLYFKAGHRILLNDEGNVISGVLVERSQLWTAKQRLFLETMFKQISIKKAR